MSKIIVYGEECRNGLKAGVDILANCVKTTFGARGNYVCIGQKFGSPSYTKDGLYVGREVESDNPLHSEGIKTALEALNKIVRLSGDGSTATAILTQAITENAVKAVSMGFNPRDLKIGIDASVAHIVANIKKLSIPVKGDAIKNIASISANNNEEIGNLIAEAVKRVGNEGLITMEDSDSEETRIEFLEGLQFDTGSMSPYFMTNPTTFESEQFNPLILLCDCKLENFNDVIPVMEIAIEEKKELFILAEDVSPMILTAFVNNRRQQGGVRVTVVRAPGFGDTRTNFLQDIAVVTGATVISEDLGMNVKDVTLAMLGSADKVVSGRENTSIIGGKGKSSDIKDRVATIKAQLKLEKEEHIQKKLKTRLSKLVGGVAKVLVGARTQAEQGELKDAIEDALEATKSAIVEGIVSGGGTCLLRAAEGLDKLPYANEDQLAGIKIIQKAAEAPLRQLLLNANVDVSMVVGKVKEGKNDFGYNVRTDKYEEFYKTGVIDPARSVRAALEYSASVGTMIMMTNCLIIEKQNNAEVAITNTGGGLF